MQSACEVLRVGLVAGVMAAAAAAQQFPQQVNNVQFNFSNPGARSMGFGGAFVALADDATAAFANPAGLVQLTRPEVSVEGRSWRLATAFTAGGRVDGDPTGNGLDVTAGLRFGESSETIEGLNFLSFVYPEKSWSLAFFRHQAADFKVTGATQGLFGVGSTCCAPRFHDQRFRSVDEVVGYGVAAGYRLGDALSLGLGVTYFDAMVDLETSLFAPDDESPAKLFGPNSYLPERLVLRQNDFTTDTEVSFSLGLLWRLSSRWRVGWVYREGPSFDLDGVLVTVGPENELGLPAGTEVFFDLEGGVSFPDVFGLGFSYRSRSERVTVAFEWDRVEYSDISTSLALKDQSVDDADELHLGGEYVFLEATPLVAVRLGVWLDPDHNLRGNDRANSFARAILQPGDDELHYAAGVGVALQAFQFDLGVDLSDVLDTVSISAIYSF